MSSGCCRRLVSRFQKPPDDDASELSSLSASRLADAASIPPNMTSKFGETRGCQSWDQVQHRKAGGEVESAASIAVAVTAPNVR